MTEEKKEIRDNDVEKNKDMAAYAYAWILFLRPYLYKKRSKFCQFHAKQGMVLFFLSFATVVPGFGQLLFLVLLFVSVLGFIKASKGEWWKIPFVYELSKKINF